MIVSLAHLWWRCAGSQPAVTNVTTELDGTAGEEYPRGQAGIKVTVEGSNIDPEATADLGQGVQITDQAVSSGGTGMTLTVAIAESAQPGARTLTVTNADCAIASFPDALTVSSAKSPKATKSTAPKRRRARRPS